MNLNELADALGTTPHVLREFAPDDITRDMTGDTEVPADVETMVRDAWASSPDGPPDVVEENRNTDAVLAETRGIVEDAGYDEDLSEDLDQRPNL